MTDGNDTHDTTVSKLEESPWLRIRKPKERNIAVPPPLFDGLEEYIKIARNDSLLYGRHRNKEGKNCDEIRAKIALK